MVTLKANNESSYSTILTSVILNFIDVRRNYSIIVNKRSLSFSSGMHLLMRFSDVSCKTSFALPDVHALSAL